MISVVTGTTTPVIRMYDVNTTQCFVSSVTSHHHTGDITSLRWGYSQAWLSLVQSFIVLKYF